MNIPRDAVVWLIVPEGRRNLLLKKVKQLLRDAGPRKHRRRTKYGPSGKKKEPDSEPAKGTPTVDTTTMGRDTERSISSTASAAASNSKTTHAQSHTQPIEPQQEHQQQQQQQQQQRAGIPLRYAPLAASPAVYIIPQSVQQQLSEACASSQNFDSTGRFDPSKIPLPSNLPREIAWIALTAIRQQQSQPPQSEYSVPFDRSMDHPRGQAVTSTHGTSESNNFSESSQHVDDHGQSNGQTPSHLNEMERYLFTSPGYGQIRVFPSTALPSSLYAQQQQRQQQHPLPPGQPYLHHMPMLQIMHHHHHHHQQQQQQQYDQLFPSVYPSGGHHPTSSSPLGPSSSDSSES